ncbi:hypothetical protein FRB91_000696 [Serendipita sp. 411]|nr:hypothetical protein FRC15_000607 [Serendipita sp. 397]KAG8817743.1 hypothetical protein FRC18_000369 [Serendipita sp. 400]KAG8827814.1 hypothetical protein FRC19_000319 [Serendipita sp. 401]KAG8846543.1 hypothetical protein FRB91_000696 [Serendipita sp. 411]KAG9058008.1 hypothetical protein FS842_002344 [Serendipita sp. 407]
MSTFKRRVQGNQIQPMRGTIPVSGAPSLLQVSTGIPSLDDLLGGGLPLGQVLLVLAPDYHSSWGELVARYFIAQGLSSEHHLLVSDHKPSRLASGCMWYPTSRGQAMSESENQEIESNEQAQDDKVKIAWRYEQLRQFKTTVETTESRTEDYCHTFDLATTVSSTVIQKAIDDGRLVYYEGENDANADTPTAFLQRLPDITGNGQRIKLPTRICINDFGGYHWGEARPSDLLHFLLRLRSSIRNTTACALLTLPAQLSNPDYAPHWITKLSYLSDGCISFKGITSDPILGPTFPSYSGLLTVHSTPSPHTLLDPSRRFSQLRGLNTASSTSTNIIGEAGNGENNLAFKCMRKRFVVETLHLDVEGGVGERRTTPSAASAVASFQVTFTDGLHPKGIADQSPASHLAKVVIDSSIQPSPQGNPEEHVHVHSDAVKPKKIRKKVVFQTADKDLYDF